MESQNISEKTLQKLAAVFKMLADRSRLKIVFALARQGEMHVTAICKLLSKSSQPAVSHHLTLMRAVGLVRVDRRGKHNYYSLASDAVRDLLDQFFTGKDGEPRAFRFQDCVLSLTHDPTE